MAMTEQYQNTFSCASPIDAGSCRPGGRRSEAQQVAARSCKLSLERRPPGRLFRALRSKPMARRVEGKVALITGGASGIGRGCAEALAAEGARVVLTDVQDAKGEEASRAIGGGARYLPHDVTSEPAWERVIADIEATEGRLDILVNNAGIGIGCPSITDDEPRRLAPAAGGQRRGRVPGRQARPAADAQGRQRRLHHQHVVGRGPEGRGDAGRLLRHQGRGAAVHQGGGHGVRQRQGRRAGQFGPSRHHRDADLAGIIGPDRRRAPTPRPISTPCQPWPCRSASRACPPTSPTASCGWPATSPATSPAPS